MAKTQKQKTGDLGEEIAVNYLKNKGYEVLERNYKKKFGEIDIIAVCHNEYHNDIISMSHSCHIDGTLMSYSWHNDIVCHYNDKTLCHDDGIIKKLLNKKKNAVLIFFEVKTGMAGSSFRVEENVHSHKKRRLIRTAQTYLLENKLAPDINWQIDVIIVELDFNTMKADLEHIKNAVYL